MKRILVLLIIFLVFAGCSSSENDQDNKPEEKNNLTFTAHINN